MEYHQVPPKYLENSEKNVERHWTVHPTSYDYCFEQHWRVIRRLVIFEKPEDWGRCPI